MASELLLLTGLPSPGKARLATALERAGLFISPAGSVHVHAQTDLEALVDPGLLRETNAAAAHADLIVPVDWEQPEQSVARVAAFLARNA
jgi:hypothetical protein